MPDPAPAASAWTWLARAALVLLAGLGAATAAGWIGQGWALIEAAPFSPPSASAWLGTNALGQDLAQRWLQALAALWTVALPAALLALAAALLLAWLAAGRGSMATLARLAIDLADAVPALLVFLALCFVLRGSLHGTVLALAACLAPESLRQLESELRRLRGSDYWTQVRASGASSWRALRVQALPPLRPLLLDQAVLLFVLAVKTEALLGLLGLANAGTVSLGGLLAEGTAAVGQGDWWPMLLPCFTLLLLVGGAGALGRRDLRHVSRIE